MYFNVVLLNSTFPVERILVLKFELFIIKFESLEYAVPPFTFILLTVRVDCLLNIAYPLDKLKVDPSKLLFKEL